MALYGGLDLDSDEAVKHIDAEFDYKRIAEEVYLATRCNQVLAEMGCTHRESTYRRHYHYGKVLMQVDHRNT